MNIVLFDAGETQEPLARADRRGQHILEVLRCGVGDSFDAGLSNGPRGKATLTALDESYLHLDFAWAEKPPPLDPITLIIGLPRPQTARKILEEVTTLGVQAMHFVTTDRGEASYARSKLWTTDEWRRHVIDGAAQAFSTRLPNVTSGLRLEVVAAGLPRDTCRLALDNYEAATPLSRASLTQPTALALGPERGWSPEERKLLRARGFELVHLGERVLRVETACVAAVTLTRARIGLL